MLKWKTFGLNRLCRSGRNIPVVVFGTEENHKISQSLQPVLWARSEPRTLVTKTHSCTFKLACSVQRAISVRFSLSTFSNCAIFQKMSFSIPKTRIYHSSSYWSLMCSDFHFICICLKMIYYHNSLRRVTGKSIYSISLACNKCLTHVWIIHIH